MRQRGERDRGSRLPVAFTASLICAMAAGVAPSIHAPRPDVINPTPREIAKAFAQAARSASFPSNGMRMKLIARVLTNPPTNPQTVLTVPGPASARR